MLGYGALRLPTLWPDRVRSRQSQETGSRPIFGDNVTEVLGRKLAAPVGRQAVARLPRPQQIDLGIGSVQAVEHVLNVRDAVPRRQRARLLDQRFCLVAHVGSLSFQLQNSGAPLTAQARGPQPIARISEVKSGVGLVVREKPGLRCAPSELIAYPRVYRRH